MNQAMSRRGIDLAKRVLPAVGRDNTGTIVFRKRVSRYALRPFLAKRSPVRIGLAAWGSAPSWARRCRAQGPAGKRMAPQVVKPSGQAHNNDSRDAEALAAAGTRPTMRVVPSKAVDPQALQALPRVRERLRGERPALGHAGHGLRHAYGSVMPTGGAKVRQGVGGTLEAAQAKRPPLSQALLWKLVEECAALEAQRAYEQEHLDTLAPPPPACQRLMTIPGRGPCTAPARVAAGSEAGAGTHGRQGAAWRGVGPRQQTTGGQERLRGISQRGDTALRQLLGPGARATIRGVERQTDRRSPWRRQLGERRGTNRAAVAVAPQNARLVWAR